MAICVNVSSPLYEMMAIVVATQKMVAMVAANSTLRFTRSAMPPMMGPQKVVAVPTARAPTRQKMATGNLERVDPERKQLEPPDESGQATHDPDTKIVRAV